MNKTKYVTIRFFNNVLNSVLNEDDHRLILIKMLADKVDGAYPSEVLLTLEDHLHINGDMSSRMRHHLNDCIYWVHNCTGLIC